MADQAQAAALWDAAYAQGDDTRGWYEEHPAMSPRMLDSAGIRAAAALIHVGGGASRLTGAPLDRGFRDLTVLDISSAGMQHARARLGSRADQVHWLAADILSWHPRRRYQVWHDRAAFHFQRGTAGPPARRRVALDQPGPGRAHHPLGTIQPLTWVALRRQS